MKKRTYLPSFIILLAGMVLPACNGTPTDTQPPPLPTATTVSPTQVSELMLPYVVVDQDLVTCFESPGPNEARYGINPLTLVKLGDAFHVLELTSQNETTHPVWIWYRIEDPSESGTTCWLPAPSVHLVGELTGIEFAQIAPTATRSGNLPFIEPRTRDISCWYGPAETWAVAGTVRFGSREALTGMLEGGDWFQVENPDSPGTWCWVRWIDITVYNDLSQLPVIPATEFPGVTPHEVGVNCRANPNGDAEILGALDVGATVPVVAMLADQSWYLIENPGNPGTVCWVFGAVTRTTGDLANIPIP
jgi:hypothetical protein